MNCRLQNFVVLHSLSNCLNYDFMILIFSKAVILRSKVAFLSALVIKGTYLCNKL
jgi:hypothetical protein